LCGFALRERPLLATLLLLAVTKMFEAAYIVGSLAQVVVSLEALVCGSMIPLGLHRFSSPNSYDDVRPVVFKQSPGV
jgi:hypothetical protein